MRPISLACRRPDFSKISNGLLEKFVQSLCALSRLFREPSVRASQCLKRQKSDFFRFIRNPFLVSTLRHIPNTTHFTPLISWIHIRVRARLIWTLLASSVAILLPRYSVDFSNVIDYATALSTPNGRNRIGIVRRMLRKRPVNRRLTLLCLCLQFGSSIVITTYVDDVNDNTPYFVNTPYTADISESTPVGKHCTRSKLPVRFIYFYFNPTRGVHSEYPSLNHPGGSVVSTYAQGKARGRSES